MAAENDWQALLQRAASLRRAGHTEAAIAAYQQLLRAQPALPDSWYNLGYLLRQARQFEAALESYAEALRQGIAEPEEVHLNRAVILSDHLHRSADAEAELRRALAANPHYVPAMLNLGNLHEDLGDREGARAMYAAALAQEPGSALALARLASVSEPAEGAAIAERLTQALARPSLAADASAHLEFALANLLDRSGAFPQAFAAAARANAASRAAMGSAFQPYDRAAQEALISRLVHSFSAAAATPSGPDARQLIFICGMFRSGSTLVEQILAAHGDVAAAGELDLIPAMAARLLPYPEAVTMVGEAQVQAMRDEYLRAVAEIAPGKRLITDKRPDNFLHVGLIKTLFPAARIVHTRRHPLDNILSLYFLHLDHGMSYALDLADAAHFYAQQERAMAHWRTLYGRDIFEVDYDVLVTAPRSVVEPLLEFCGLEWRDSCLDFHRVARPVKTASVWQVREPLHRRSSGRWRNYAEQLQPVREQLARQAG